MRLLDTVTATAALLLLAATSAAAQSNPSDLAAILRADDRAGHGSVLARLQDVPAGEIGPELKTALIELLEREGRLRADARNGRIPPIGEGLIGWIVPIVTKFDDPRAIPGLTGALGSSPYATDYLAAFGQPAAVAILDLLGREDHTGVWQDALVTLRYIVEREGIRPLDPETRREIRDVAADLLKGGRHVTLLWGGIDLAAALGDPELRAELTMLRGNAAALSARGIKERDLSRTLRQIDDRLAGVPARPVFELPDSAGPPLPY